MKQMSNVTKVLKISFHNNMNHESAFRLIFPSQYAGHMVGLATGLTPTWSNQTRQSLSQSVVRSGLIIPIY